MKSLPFFCFAMAVMAVLFSCKSEPIGGKLEGTYWTLSSAKLANQTISLAKTAETSLVFSEGKLTGKAPCNSYFADYSAKGSAISLSELGATKRFCDEMDLENAYLSLLSKAQSYSVRGDKLEIVSSNGQLTFFQMKQDKAEAARYSQGVGKLAALFPMLEGDVMLHLHPILRVDNPGNYPYQGTIIDTSFYKFFSAEIREIWSGGGGDVMAIGQYGGFYICRVPGRYVSSDIAIFRIQEGEMQHVETVAWAWCDEGWCNQQDAWLTDTDKDGLTDVVQHYTLTDDRGKIKEERLTLLLQTENGELLPDESAKPEKGKFKMARI
ncbi:MAG: META domain-containing protein [Saprospiraceae bacterium]|nr:META domain-containing protein [Saprospiraceae bacterium]